MSLESQPPLSLLSLKPIMAAKIDTLDLVVLIIILLGTAAYFTKGKLWAKQKDPYGGGHANGSTSQPDTSRDIIEKLEETDKNCVVFYGSQTGTAEDYAQRLAKEGSSRYGLKTMTADLEDYDYENLDKFPEDKVAIFVLATYGEGEPTDNANDFYEFISNENVSFGDGGASGESLQNFHYIAFGLGNNTYEHYNSMVRNVSAAFDRLGAKRIGDAGEGDDGAGTMEEDFLAWKEPTWAALKKVMHLEEREAVYEPSLEVTEKPDLNAEDDTVYLGEPNKNHLESSQKGPYNHHNPYIAPIAESKELFNDPKRNCLHMEIDISASGLKYSTGDHIAVWPTNPGREVDRFLKIAGLSEKRNNVIAVRGIDATAKVPFPSPTTYDAVARYQLEICAPVSRQFVASLAQFAPNDAAKKEIAKIGGDKAYFQETVARKHYNIAQLLETLTEGQPWPSIPFALWCESLNKIQPRYYSISSSSRVQPQKVAITAVVESKEIAGTSQIVKGVTTNYLLALMEKQHGVKSPDPNGLRYAITGPRNKYDGIHVPVHIRHSNFKLPSDPKKPIIMVGPGTGVAPFRGFIQERAFQASKGQEIGKTILFFGCRKEKEDFMYQDEWKQYASQMGDKFELITAFSRDGPSKVYVQHRLKERAVEINQLLEQKAYFYVCGDAANMAREVNENLIQIISEQRGVPKSKAESVVKSMRASNLYQEDVWS